MVDPIIVADIGGTNARFAIAEKNGNVISLREMTILKAADFETMQDAADSFLKSVGEKPKCGCIAVAGPIVGENVKLTNSHWLINAESVAERLRMSRIHVVNDFYALAAGIRYLPREAVINVKPGTPAPDAPTLVIGPGTGFGQAVTAPTTEGTKVIATEGGHVAFAAQMDEEREISSFIARKHGRVTVERVVSGPGLVNIYGALCAVEATPPELLRGADITAAALNGRDSIAVRAVNAFCDTLGGVAGDAVLATGARGGVILGGGLLPKVRTILEQSNFTARFSDKGRMSDYMRDVPVNMIVAEDAALYGAAAAFFAGDQLG